MTARSARRRSLPALVAAGAAIASLAACSGDDGGGSSSGDFSVAGALGDLPSSALEDDYIITAADLERASELAGVDMPGPDADADEIADWSLTVAGVRRADEPWPVVSVQLPEAANPRSLLQIDEFRDELGWSIAEVGSYVEVVAPPTRFTVLHGDLDAANIDDAIGDREDGLWSIGGEDFEVDVANRSAARPLGESLRLAEQDGAVAVSKSTPPIEDWLEEDDRLDDDDALAAVAAALDEHDVYTATIIDGDSLVFAPPTGRETTPEELEALMGEQLLPFEVLGTGLAVVDDEAVGVLAYEHATADHAAENAELLETMFAEGVSIRTAEALTSYYRDVEVSVDDTVVTVTLRFTDETSPQNLWRAIQVRELFASHG